MELCIVEIDNSTGQELWETKKCEQVEDGEAKRFCRLNPGSVYRAAVKPPMSLCSTFCPQISWTIPVPEQPTQLPVSDIPDKDPSQLMLFSSLAVAGAVAVAAAALLWRRVLGRRWAGRSAASRPRLEHRPEVTEVTALLLTRGAASGAAARQLRRLRARLEAGGITTLSLQDRQVVSHLQRHPSPADALSRPPLRRARLLFISGGGSGSGDVQQRLFNSLLQHVRGSRLAYDYRRVFVLSLSGAAPGPPLADVTGGRLFRADGDTDLLIQHLGAAADRDSDADWQV